MLLPDFFTSPWSFIKTVVGVPGVFRKCCMGFLEHGKFFIWFCFSENTSEIIYVLVLSYLPEKPVIR